MKKTLALCLAVLLITTLFSSCTSGASSAVPEEPIAEFGKTVELEDFNYTITAIKEKDVVVHKDFIEFNAEEGKKLLLIFMDLKNITSEEQSYLMLLFKVIIDGEEIPHVQFSYDVEVDGMVHLDRTHGNFQGHTYVDAGKTQSGYLLAEVPENWQSGEIVVQTKAHLLFARSNLTE